MTASVLISGWPSGRPDTDVNVYSKHETIYAHVSRNESSCRHKHFNWSDNLFKQFDNAHTCRTDGLGWGALQVSWLGRNPPSRYWAACWWCRMEAMGLPAPSCLQIASWTKHKSLPMRGGETYRPACLGTSVQCPDCWNVRNIRDGGKPIVYSFTYLENLLSNYYGPGNCWLLCVCLCACTHAHV